MALVTVTITSPPELDALLLRLDATQSQVVGERAGLALAPKLTRWLQEDSQALAGYGPFAQGWLATPNGSGVRIRNNFGKARFIELPTAPHIIRPRPGTHLVSYVTKKGKTVSYEAPNMLAWMPGRGAFSAVYVKQSTKSGQKWFRAKEVHHPGTKGKHVFEDVILSRQAEIFQAIKDQATAILSGT